jgi:hypothetical protein
MADLFLTRKELESLFWQATMQMLNLNPDLPEHAGRVRKSWQPGGAPAWKIDDNIAFIRIGEQDDAFNILRDTVYQPEDDEYARELTGYTRVLRVQWVLYGPDSFDNAFRIRNRLYMTRYRQPLTDNQIYLIPRVATPRRMPELFSGQWWERTDLAADFNELVQSEQKVAYLQSTEIQIAGKRSLDASVNEEITPREENERSV